MLSIKWLVASCHTVRSQRYARRKDISNKCLVTKYFKHFFNNFVIRLHKTDRVSGGRFYPIFVRNRTSRVTQFPAWGSVFCWYLVWVQGRSVITKLWVSRDKWGPQTQSLANQKLVTLVTLWGTRWELSNVDRGTGGTCQPPDNGPISSLQS